MAQNVWLQLFFLLTVRFGKRRESIWPAMAPKQTKGGAGHRSAQDYVTGLWTEGKTDKEIRERLKADGYKAGRISQLLKATRPAPGQAAAVPKAAPGPKQAVPGPSAMRRPAAAEAG